MLPNLFLIGAMRSGTTSLNSMLGQHPEIYIPETKEPMYYLAEYYRSLAEDADPPHAEPVAAYRDFERRGKFRTAESYAALYAGASGKKYILDSSHYLSFPDVAAIIKRNCPHAKIVITLRDPAERLYSEYQLHRRNGSTQGDFSQWMSNDCTLDSDGHIVTIGERSRIRKGFYAKLLQPWLETFGTNSVFIVFYDDLRRDAAATVKSIYHWLQLLQH